MARQTPLIACHRAAGARLVDFAGWAMPLSYGSQIEEHHAVRRVAGMFDVSHMLAVDVEGSEAARLLLYLLANSVAKLSAPGKALYTCMLNPEGGVIDDLIVYLLGQQRYRLVLNAGTADGDLAWIRRQVAALPANVSVTPRRDLAIIAVQGPQAREKVWQALPQARAASEGLKPFAAAEVEGLMLARTGYTGEDGFELMLPAARAAAAWEALRAAGVVPCGLGARDTLRLEAGMNLYGQDMDQKVTPLECGLAWTLDFSPGREFIGRAALEGATPARQQVGLVLLERGVLRAHQTVFTPHGAGETTSGGFAPTLARSIALARVPAAVAAGDTLEVEVRDKRLPVRVVKPPFVRHGRSLID